MSVEIIKSALCSPTGDLMPDEIGYSPELYRRQLMTVNASRNNVYECSLFLKGECKKSGTECLPNKGNFFRVIVLP